MAVRTQGRLWAFVVCPIIGWAVFLLGESVTHGRLGMGGGILCFGIVPAALAGAENARLGGERRSIVRASVGAASICFVGVMVDAIVFLLTVPPGFFQ